jgi:creatinine amidohydrolase
MQDWESRLVHLRIERLRPKQIEAALALRSLVYIPLGALEYHGHHLPIGLDAMTAHGLCLQACEQTGGLVMPPLYYGMTGSIGHHPWTICVEKEETLKQLYLDTLNRLSDFGIEQAVLFTGHFGRRQLALMAELQNEWNANSSNLRLQCLSISDLPGVEIPGDHGALFETSVLTQLHPDRVHLNELPNQTEFPANDPDGDSWGAHRRDPENVLFGILGDDPRDYQPEQAQALTQALLKGLVELVEA